MFSTKKRISHEDFLSLSLENAFHFSFQFQRQINWSLSSFTEQFTFTADRVTVETEKDKNGLQNSDW